MLTQKTQNKNKTKLSLRCDEKSRDLIDQAAELTGKTRTEFMLETSCKEAERILLDQRHFFLNESDYEEFIKRLDNPVDNQKLKSLLASKAPWDK